MKLPEAMGSCLARTFGLLMGLFGLYYVLLVLAYSSMIDPSIEGSAWWAEYLDNLVRQGVEISLAVVLIVTGGWLLFAPARLADKVSSFTLKPPRDDFQ